MTPFRLVNFSRSRILSPGIDLRAGGSILGRVGRPKGDAFDPK
jgi:hypothetical protein